MLRKGTPHEVATQGSVNTRMGVERCVRYAFELASTRPRQHLTLVHKTNVLTFAGDLWQRTFDEVAAEFPDVATAYNHVDAATIYFVQDPQRYDVIVTDNLFGDILTDLGGAVSGGVGLASSANLNPARTGPSMFEPVHGSAPDIAGTGTANPRAAILSAALMLDFLGEADAAERIRARACAEPVTGSTTSVGDADRRPEWRGLTGHADHTDAEDLDERGARRLGPGPDPRAHPHAALRHGVFEGIRAYETSQGPAVFRLTDHIVRLHNSAKIIGMELPVHGRRARRGDQGDRRLDRAAGRATSARSPTSATARWGSTRCRARSTWPSPAGRGAPTSATTPSPRACG